MGDRRKPILVNRYEKLAHDAILAACESCGAHVFPKVRVADALDINNSGLPSQDFSYALKAHFDFVIAGDDTRPRFAVEFDGPGHFNDATTMAMDSQKNRICEQLGMPLLRIDDLFLQNIRGESLLGWLVDTWFTKEAFEQAQVDGIIPLDEPFHWSFLVRYDSATGAKRYGDPFVQFRLFVQKMYLEGKCEDFGAKFGLREDEHKFVVAVAILRHEKNQFVVGRARCRPFQFDAVTYDRELAIELAYVDAAEQLRRVIAGENLLISRESLLKRVHQIKDWEGLMFDI